jgi:YesN/AraC family two-component response regulator
MHARRGSPLSAAPSTTSRRVLVVDTDHATYRIACVAMPGSYTVSWVTTGREGLCRMSEVPPDVVITEWRLPDCSGGDFISSVRTCRAGLPVIVVTAYSSDRVQSAVRALGVRDYLVKPFDPAAMERCLQRLVPADGSNQPAGVQGLRLAPGSADANAWRIQQAVHVIQEQYDGPVSLTALARETGMSRFAFSRAFRSVMGRSFRDYLAHYRVAQARALLEHGVHSVSEVAHIVGFGDLPRFDRVFKRRVGVSPSRYRADARPPATSDNTSARSF